uniref:Uncharacterized protein n=1 Tax=Arundo donax TaxID=35708 RepID=A0A0A9C258_ARUDO
MLKEGRILELHLGKESLTVVELPPREESMYQESIQLMEAESSVLGFAAVKEYSVKLWAREADVDGSARGCCARSSTSTCSL